MPTTMAGSRAFAPHSLPPSMPINATLRLGGLAQIKDASMKAEAATMQQNHRRDVRVEKAVCNAATVELIQKCLQFNWELRGKEGEVPAHVVNVFLKGRAVSTLEAYTATWKRWEEFCGADGIDKCLPVDPWEFSHLIAMEAMRLDFEGKTASSIDNLVSAVTFFCEKVSGCKNPMADSIANMTVDAARRYLGYKNKPKDPILQQHIRSIWEAFGKADSSLNKVACLLRLSASQEGLLRWDDLVALRAGHFLFSDDPDAQFRAFLIHTKTDQYREGQWAMFSQRDVPWSTQQLLLRMLEMVHNAWCSMTAEERLEHAQWADEEGQLQLIKLPLVFSTIELDSGLQFPQHPEMHSQGVEKATAAEVKKWVKQQYASFGKWIKTMAALAGIKGDFAVHSGRRGGATDMFKAGLTERLIKAAGRWRTDKAMNRYIDDEQALRLCAGVTKKLRFPGESGQTFGEGAELHLGDFKEQPLAKPKGNKRKADQSKSTPKTGQPKPKKVGKAKPKPSPKKDQPLPEKRRKTATTIFGAK